MLGVSRATAYRQTKPRPRFYTRAEDGRVLEEIRTITRRKDSYGYRRVTARVNRLFGKRYNRKRIRRVMRMHGLQIPPRVHRRTGRAHTGRIATEQSNTRGCSDALEISCWNGEIVQVGFALDCCDLRGARLGGGPTRSHRGGHPPSHEPLHGAAFREGKDREADSMAQ